MSQRDLPRKLVERAFVATRAADRRPRDLAARQVAEVLVHDLSAADRARLERLLAAARAQDGAA